MTIHSSLNINHLCLITRMSVTSSAPTDVLQRIRLLRSLKDPILDHRAHAQKCVPRIAVTTPVRHDTHCHSCQSRITAFVDCSKAVGQGHKLLPELRSLLMIFEYLERYLLSQSGWQSSIFNQSCRASIHYNTVPANNRINGEPSLHCIMTRLVQDWLFCIYI